MHLFRTLLKHRSFPALTVRKDENGLILKVSLTLPNQQPCKTSTRWKSPKSVSGLSLKFQVLIRTSRPVIHPLFSGKFVAKSIISRSPKEFIQDLFMLNALHVSAWHNVCCEYLFAVIVAWTSATNAILSRD